MHASRASTRDEHDARFLRESNRRLAHSNAEASALAVQGIFHEARGNPDVAIESYAAAIQLWSESDPIESGYNKCVAFAWNQLGALYLGRAHANQDARRNSLRHAVLAFGRCEGFEDITVGACATYNKALCYQLDQQFSVASQLYNQCISFEDASESILVVQACSLGGLARMQENAGDHVTAYVCYFHANVLASQLALLGLNKDIIHRMSQCSTKMGKLADATSLAEEALFVDRVRLSDARTALEAGFTGLQRPADVADCGSPIALPHIKLHASQAAALHNRSAMKSACEVAINRAHQELISWKIGQVDRAAATAKASFVPPRSNPAFLNHRAPTSSTRVLKHHTPVNQPKAHGPVSERPSSTMRRTTASADAAQPASNLEWKRHATLWKYNPRMQSSTPDGLLSRPGTGEKHAREGRGRRSSMARQVSAQLHPEKFVENRNSSAAHQRQLNRLRRTSGGYQRRASISLIQQMVQLSGTAEATVNGSRVVSPVGTSRSASSTRPSSRARRRTRLPSDMGDEGWSCSSNNRSPQT